MAAVVVRGSFSHPKAGLNSRFLIEMLYFPREVLAKSSMDGDRLSCKYGEYRKIGGTVAYVLLSGVVGAGYWELSQGIAEVNEA